MLKLIEKVRKLFKNKNIRLTLEELAKELNLKDDEVEVLKLVLNELELQGEIYLNDSQEYMLFPDDKNLAIGQLRFDKRKQPFVLIGHNVVFIPENHLNGAIIGDTVLVRKNNFVGFGETKTTVSKILNRQNHFIIFECYKSKNKKRVRPYNSPFKCQISLSKNDWQSISIGDRFAVQVGTINHNGIFHGDIIFKIGSKDDPLLTLKTIVASHGIRIGYPKEVEEEIQNIPTTVTNEEIEREIKNGRIDLRNKVIFTIDGKNVKDIDDAASLEINERGNYVLGIHIADVAYYVKEGSAIQKEAAIRATSYYFGSLVIHMLPPKLSNGVCSLNPNVDRFTRTSEIEISPAGEIISYKIYKSIIHSRKQMVYEDINQIISGKRKPEDYEEFMPIIDSMFQLSDQLERIKEQRGHINLGSSEFTVITDENGSAIDIIPIQRGRAQKLIENFALLANELMAKDQKRIQSSQNLPYIYRVHGCPNKQRIDEVINYLAHSGFPIEKKDYQNPKDFQLLLKSLSTLPAFPVISETLIRGLSKAKYSINNTGHYGLALECYTHSTSPIRRYSDLQTQYNMDNYGQKEPSQIDIESQTEKMNHICHHNSRAEKIADITEREILGYQLTQYMESKVGEEFTGMITYISKHHVVIRTTDYVTGTLDTKELLDLGYTLMGEGTTLVNKSTKKQLRMGDFIQVFLKEASLESRKITFSLSKQREKIYVKEA